jgi:hypothetical protein
LLQCVPLELFVLAPCGLGILDILVLSFLGAATKQDDKPITILAEINSVAWAEVDLVFRYAFTNGLIEDVLPPARRSKATVTLVAAATSRPSNHVLYSLRPLASRYS